MTPTNAGIIFKSCIIIIQHRNSFLRFNCILDSIPRKLTNTSYVRHFWQFIFTWYRWIRVNCVMRKLIICTVKKVGNYWSGKNRWMMCSEHETPCGLRPKVEAACSSKTLLSTCTPTRLYFSRDQHFHGCDFVAMVWFPHWRFVGLSYPPVRSGGGEGVAF